MAIPKVNDILLPLLESLRDKKEHSYKNTIEHISDYFDLTESERKEIIASGYHTRIETRVGWARTHLRKAELIEYIRRGHFKITKRGLNLLSKKPKCINNKMLEQYPEYLIFINKSKKTKDEANEESLSPRELFENSYQNIKDELKSELLDQLYNLPPSFFERLVVELIVAMGYGGSKIDAGKAIGQSNDEGIDGIIKEDQLGLDNIYIQAKLWRKVVGRPAVQKFVGALQGKKTKKGIFITTSTFTKGALEYITKIESKVALIDGDNLTDLMIENNVGVSIREKYELKVIDIEYFTE